MRKNTHEENMLEKIYTKKETAWYLESSTATIDRLRKCGKISSIRIGGRIMFRENEILRFIEEAGV